MKLHRQVAELWSRFDEREEQLKAATSAVRAKVEEVTDYQAALHRYKDKLMEEGERVVELKVTDTEKATQLAHLERVRENVGQALERMEAERNELMRKLAQTRANYSVLKRSVETSMRTELCLFRREVEFVVTRAFEGLNQLEGPWR